MADHGAQEFAVAARKLAGITGRIVEHPLEAKYARVRMSDPSFNVRALHPPPID